MKYSGNVAQDKRSNACKPGRPTEGKHTGQAPSTCRFCDGRYDPLLLLLHVVFHAQMLHFWILKRIRKDNIFTEVIFLSFVRMKWVQTPTRWPQNSVNKLVPGERWVQWRSACVCFQNKSHGHATFLWVFLLDKEIQRPHKMCLWPSTQSVLLFSLSLNKKHTHTLTSLVIKYGI